MKLKPDKMFSKKFNLWSRRFCVDSIKIINQARVGRLRYNLPYNAYKSFVNLWF